jgi:hypothetical protein
MCARANFFCLHELIQWSYVCVTVCGSDTIRWSPPRVWIAKKKHERAFHLSPITSSVYFPYPFDRKTNQSRLCSSIAAALYTELLSRGACSAPGDPGQPPLLAPLVGPPLDTNERERETQVFVLGTTGTAFICVDSEIH